MAAFASPGPSRTWPAITAAAARVRDGKSPRSASRESRRTRGTARNGSGCAALTDFRAAVGHPGIVTRTISLPTHSALELLGGLVLLAGPFVLGAGPAAMVAAISLGAVVIGLALAGPDSLPISAHQSFDLMLVAALAGGGLGLALAGDPAGGLVLVAVGAPPARCW